VTDPYVGEIRMFAGNFPPLGWAFCDGSIMAIATNEVLYTLLGTTYGGDGTQTFGLPNLISRIPFCVGPNRSFGEVGGTESVTLTTGELPAHSHTAMASNNPGTATAPAGQVWATGSDTPYTTNPPNAAMSSAALAPVGNGLPHDNRPPFLALNFIISLVGIFPSQS
jgi:microcystin-dependent protein